MSGSQINSDSKMEALEIEAELLDAILCAGEDGLSFKHGSNILGVDYDRFYLLVHQLVRLGRVKIERGQAGNANRIFLPHQELPTLKATTDKQKAVLEFLCSKMDHNNLIRVSFAKICAGIKSTSTTASDIVDRLDNKGYLEVVERGNHLKANLYRVYPNRDGPEGYSWPGTGRLS